MSHLFGLIHRAAAAGTATTALSRLRDSGFRGTGWIAHDGEQLVRQQGRGLPVPLPISGRLALLRLDWELPQQHALTVADGQLGLVWRGAITNADEIADVLTAVGYSAGSLYPAELAANLLQWHLSTTHDLLQAAQATAAQMQGVYAFVATSTLWPDQLVCSSQHVPLLLASADDCAAVADQLAPLSAIASQVIKLADGDVARLQPGRVEVLDVAGKPALRTPDRVDRREAAPDFFRYYMEKEIREQPAVLADTLGRTGFAPDLAGLLDEDAARLLAGVEQVILVGSGSSYQAALTARYWLEALAGLPAQVEHASEYRFRDVAMPQNTLLIAISQSGETADTVASLALAQRAGALYSLAITNDAGSTLAQKAQFSLCTAAGPEVGLTSTKTFTAQLLSLYLLAQGLARQRGYLAPAELAEVKTGLAHLPQAVEDVLQLEGQLAQWAHRLAERTLLLYTARHQQFPIALEGAQKMLEVAYLHAEGHPGGELKHGPLALVDRHIAVVACMPWNRHAEKLLSNLQEVRSRQGELFVLSDTALAAGEHFNTVRMPPSLRDLDPILYSVALQLLAYRVALARGTEIDNPRHLAKAFAEE
ncbi:glutamine--fructose-6-phosphate transaminase (isomerizing) [Chitinolyticbacter meiyuanensis]|uniref:glutamine--fructose-6-phosphate transaminase (isomerizing) n=1 Tax=Chitinolyticbacter meiyuanensis TaxID=682798 RepID=UPI0011E5CE13|nr:glutamine--fructose-6-phosphate transaminase (isomerizing) [Chitinolyticbacter meiyuanensis]